jgi:hypothetical protein
MADDGAPFGDFRFKERRYLFTRRPRSRSFSTTASLWASSRAPELNGQENIWQFMRQNWLSNRIFKSFDDIVDHCCYAWNTLIDQPWKIMSIARHDWAAVGHSN